MGTTWSVRACLPDPRLALRPGIEAVFDRVVAEMSPWLPTSDISRFNRSSIGSWQVLPPGFVTVLRAGLDIAAISEGAFDPAIGRLVDHWGFGADPAAGRAGPLPDAWRAIDLDGDRARRTADVTLDLSGIAKGHAVDAVADWLLHHGIHDFLVEAGGELRGHGIKPDGQPWWVDLEPVPGQPHPTTRIALCGIAVATSGNYRRFTTTAGRHDSHSIDPRTGIPARHAIAAVSVLDASAMRADAWATALTILGHIDALTLAAQKGLAAIITTRTPTHIHEHMTPALAAMCE